MHISLYKQRIINKVVALKEAYLVGKLNESQVVPWGHPWGLVAIFSFEMHFVAMISFYEHSLTGHRMW